jgi:hypothetical protein
MFDLPVIVGVFIWAVALPGQPRMRANSGAVKRPRRVAGQPEVIPGQQSRCGKFAVSSDR